MSELRVDSINDAAGTGPVAFPNGTTGGFLGKTDGIAVAAGEIGELIEDSSISTTALVTATTANIASITLTPGVWQIFGQGYIDALAGTTLNRCRVSISSISATDDFSHIDIDYITVSDEDLALTNDRYVNISSSTTYYLTGYSNFTGGNAQILAARCKFYAVRVG